MGSGEGPGLSAILSRACRRLPADWRDHYGYEPAFVDSSRFQGT
jgi:hypothetical protein